MTAPFKLIIFWNLNKILETHLKCDVLGVLQESLNLFSWMSFFSPLSDIWAVFLKDRIFKQSEEAFFKELKR